MKRYIDICMLRKNKNIDAKELLMAIVQILWRCILRKIIKKQELIIFLLPCFACSFIFVSLFKYNDVFWKGIIQTFPEIWLPVIAITVLIYIIAICVWNKGSQFLLDVLEVFDTPKQMHISYYICGTIVFWLLYNLMIHAPMDYPVHTAMAVNDFDWRFLVESILSMPYPIWHICVNLLYKVLSIPPIYAAALTSAAFYTLEYSIVVKIMLSLNEKNSVQRCSIFSLLLMLVQPIYLPWFNETQVLGQGTPNVWHNPTIVSCYPFALITVFVSLRLFKKYEQSERIKIVDWVRFGGFLFLSVIAKPAFAQIIIPALAVWLLVWLIKSRGKSFMFSVQLVVSCIPSGLWCILILMLGLIMPSDVSDGGGIGVGFLEVWSHYTPSVPISIILASAFPIMYILLNFKELMKKNISKFALLLYCVGLMENACLKELGDRMYHGNLGWGYNVGQTILLVYIGACFLHYFDNKDSRKQIIVLIPSVILTLHILFGIYYYIGLYSETIII